MSPVIKKIALALALAFVAAFLSAQEEADPAYYAAGAGSDAEDANPYYFNVLIEKIYVHPRGYYILYRTSSGGIANMCVPVEWMGRGDNRAVYRLVRAGVSPYVSYITNNGEFYQLRINAPSDSGDLVWGGVIGRDRVPDEAFDADTVYLQF